MVRNDYGDPLRSIYLTNPLVRVSSPYLRAATADHRQAVIENNEYTRLRLVSAGVKAFTRQDSSKSELPCKWRVPSDGLGEVLPWIGEGVVRDMSIADLRVLCATQYPEVADFADGPEGPRQWLDEAGAGNLIVRFRAGQEAGGQ